MTSLTGHSELDAEPSGDEASTGRLGDRIFSGLATGSGAFVVLLILLVAAFLISQAVPALMDNKANFLTSRVWEVSAGSLRFGIPDLLYVTVISSIVAMLIAVPIAIAVALFLTQYAPKRLATPFGYLVDLLAAVPSIVYGLWGARIFAPRVQPIQDFLGDHFGWIPFFEPPASSGTVFIAAL